jgi:hypothetical protein
MDLNLEHRDGLLLATVTGQVSFREAVECWKKVCDAAAENGCGKILFDWLGVEGEISDLCTHFYFSHRGSSRQTANDHGIRSTGR